MSSCGQFQHQVAVRLQRGDRAGRDQESGHAVLHQGRALEACPAASASRRKTRTSPLPTKCRIPVGSAAPEAGMAGFSRPSPVAALTATRMLMTSTTATGGTRAKTAR